MDKPTIADFVKKWSPMTEDINGHVKEMMSWALEEEARYLRKNQDSTTGASLKYIFPLVRRTIALLTGAEGKGEPTVLGADISAGVVHELTVEAFGDICEATVSSLPKKDHAGVTEFHTSSIENGFVDDISARIYNAIVSFPRS